MSAKLNDELIRICIEHAKIQATNESKGTSTRVAHATSKLDEIASKLYQIYKVTKFLSGNVEASDKITAQATIVDGPIYDLDALDAVAIKLDQMFDELIQVISRSIKIT
jgi:hypothetical protein